MLLFFLSFSDNFSVASRIYLLYKHQHQGGQYTALPLQQPCLSWVSFRWETTWVMGIIRSLKGPDPVQFEIVVHPVSSNCRSSFGNGSLHFIQKGNIIYLSGNSALCKIVCRMYHLLWEKMPPLLRLQLRFWYIVKKQLSCNIRKRCKKFIESPPLNINFK